MDLPALMDENNFHHDFHNFDLETSKKVNKKYSNKQIC